MANYLKLNIKRKGHVWESWLITGVSHHLNPDKVVACDIDGHLIEIRNNQVFQDGTNLLGTLDDSFVDPVYIDVFIEAD